jgi:Kef-type K+ transport system membrane component KefB
MKLLFVISIIIVISLLGSRITYKRLPLGFKNILFTGTEYIFMGVILGKSGLKILDFQSLNSLEPFLIFGLCLIGFLYGLQFEYRQLKSLPRSYFAISAVQASLTFILVTFCSYLIFNILFNLPDYITIMISITLGSSACCTAQSAIAVVSKNYRIENRKLLSLLRYISSVDGLFALGFFAFALSIIPSQGSEKFQIIITLKWLLMSILIGVLSSLILIILSKVKFSHQEYVVFVLGVLLFCSGLAIKIHHSPLVAGLICGIMTANFCRHRLRALAIVVNSEKTVYIIFLILLGAGWSIQIDSILIITCVYFLIRIIGKLLASITAVRIFKTGEEIPSSFGLGLISEGGLAVAIIVNFKILYPSFANDLITIVLLSMFLNEFISPRLILSQIRGTKRSIFNEG